VRAQVRLNAAAARVIGGRITHSGVFPGAACEAAGACSLTEAGLPSRRNAAQITTCWLLPRSCGQAAEPRSAASAGPGRNGLQAWCNPFPDPGLRSVSKAPLGITAPAVVLQPL